MSVENWRKKIDEIDAAILFLLNQRAAYSREIGLIKKELEVPAYDRSRETEILERLDALNQGPLSNDAMHRLFERILIESRWFVKDVLLDPQSQHAAEATEHSQQDK